MRRKSYSSFAGITWRFALACLVLLTSCFFFFKCVNSVTSDKFFPKAIAINVKTQYGAKGDGVTDDTKAIRKAIQENHRRPIYFPAGTYLVSDRLEYRNLSGKFEAFTWLQGQNRATTTIRLKNNAPGYADPTHPKAVVYAASSNDGNHVSKEYLEKGEGNQAFANYVEDITIDTGNNRGAIALDYLASNLGAVRNVIIRGRGVVGLDMSRGLMGPGLIKNLLVKGFDYGIRVYSGASYGVTLEHITLHNQRKVGIENQGNVLAIRDLSSTNSVPAVRNNTVIGLITLVDGNLQGGNSSVSAIENNNDGRLFVRNVRTSGYRSAIKQNGQVVKKTTVSEYTSSPPFTLFPNSPKTSLNLSVEEPPTYHDNNLSNWANVEDFGARTTGNDKNVDSTNAFQKALDSGKSTVYIPLGMYSIRGTLHVRKNVRRIIGINATLAPTGEAFANKDNPQPLFRIENGAPQAVTIEHIWINDPSNSPHPGLIGFEQATSRTLFLKDIQCGTPSFKYTFRNTKGVGKLFIEDVSAIGWQFEHPQQVWARQFDPEGSVTRVFNNGGALWILGFKTEGYLNTIIHTTGGGATELLGGALYYNVNVSPNDVAFINNNSRVSLSYGTVGFGVTQSKIHVQETRGSKTRDLIQDKLLWRGEGRAVPLYVGR